VYAGNDIVSDHLTGEGHMWEEAELTEFLWALRAPVPGRPDGFGTPPEASASGKSGGANGNGNHPPPPPPPLAIDIGANIGWFMINAAAAGARVSAFEAMTANVRLLRATLCANPSLASRVALYATGVGESDSDCVMISGTTNRGDGHTICGEQARDIPGLLKGMKAGTGYDYEARGEMTVRRLDRMLVGAGVKGGDGTGGGTTGGGNASKNDKAPQEEHELETPAVVKIDIEGFEEPALRGASAMLDDPRTRPWFVLTECNLGILAHGGRDYIRFLGERGYALSEKSFRGPFFTQEQVKRGETGYAGTNLYCVRRDWLDSPEGKKALGGEARYVGEATEAQTKLAG
jgi:FkbM family methyltransferase